jgi:hypothetical protein
MYQVVLDTVQNIPIPTKVLATASQKNLEIDCLLSISFFDLESGTFFGKTWTSPTSIQLVKNVESNSEEEDSDSEDAPIDKQRAHLIGNKLVLSLKNQVCIHIM